MGLELGIFGRNGVKHTGDTVGNIISDHIFNKEHGEVNAHNREEQEEQVIGALVKSRSEQQLYFVHNAVQEISCHRRQKADDKSQDKGHLAVRNMFFLPIHHLTDPSLFLPVVI